MDDLSTIRSEALSAVEKAGDLAALDAARVAALGKKEYPLPMFVNAWIVQPNDIGAGDYPSGGPEPLVHDIWRAGGPAWRTKPRAGRRGSSPTGPAA